MCAPVLATDASTHYSPPEEPEPDLVLVSSDAHVYRISSLLLRLNSLFFRDLLKDTLTGGCGLFFEEERGGMPALVLNYPSAALDLVLPFIVQLLCDRCHDPNGRPLPAPTLPVLRDAWHLANSWQAMYAITMIRRRLITFIWTADKSDMLAVYALLQGFADEDEVCHYVVDRLVAQAGKANCDPFTFFESLLALGPQHAFLRDIGFRKIFFDLLVAHAKTNAANHEMASQLRADLIKDREREGC